MNKPLKEFSERLRKAMIDAGHKPEAAVLERGFNQHYYGKGVSLQGVNKWLKGQSMPSYDKIVTLSIWLKVPLDELTFGIEVKHRVEQASKRWSEEIGYQERELFEAFLALPAPQKKIVREVILAFKKAYG